MNEDLKEEMPLGSVPGEDRGATVWTSSLIRAAVLFGLSLVMGAYLAAAPAPVVPADDTDDSTDTATEEVPDPPTPHGFFPGAGKPLAAGGLPSFRKEPRIL